MRTHTMQSLLAPRCSPQLPRRHVNPYRVPGIELLADLYTPYGFVACGQDMRGTQLSEGNFTVWHTDADDAYDTMQWITDQSWSSGLVNTIGGRCKPPLNEV